MIVKVFRNKGAGSPTASVRYLIGKNGDREKATVLKGDIELTRQLAESLDFKNRYTVGVLSFEEQDLPKQTKQDIMADFEKTLFAGLDESQYSIAWVEHRDKDRLELNFFIANVELSTGKRLQPYYDRVDRGLVNVWKDVTNYGYSLSDPNNPQKRLDIQPNQALPKTKKELRQAVHEYIKTGVLGEQITDRNQVIQAMQDLGLEIARTTKTAISIRDPDGGQNIRFKGEYYEQDFRVDESYTAKNDRASREYQAERERAIGAKRAELFSRIEAKRSYLDGRYQSSRPQNNRLDNQAHYERGDYGGLIERYSGSDSDNGLYGLSSQRGENGAVRATREHRTIAPRSPSPSQSEDWKEQKWGDLDRSQECQESKGRDIRRHQQALTDTGVVTRHEPLFDTLQRANGRFGAEIQRTKLPSEAIDERKQAASRADTAINRAIGATDSTEQQIKRAEQAINDLNRASQEFVREQKAVNKGFER